MSIQNELDKIKNAVYGREVRGAIHDGIKKAYDDASEKDNANMEVKIARGTHPNLRSRLEEVDNKQQQTTAQLAQKADKLKVRANTSDIPINVAEMDTETKQLFSGGAVAVVGKRAVGFENMKPKAITVDTTDFLTHGTNYFNKNNVVKGFYITWNTGATSTNAPYFYSSPIRVTPGDVWSVPNSEFTPIAFYKGGAYVSGMSRSGLGNNVVIPENVDNMIISAPLSQLETFVVNIGATLKPYEKFGYYAPDLLSIGTEIPEVKPEIIVTLNDAWVAWLNGEKFPIAFFGDSTVAGFGTTSYQDGKIDGTETISPNAFTSKLQTLLRDATNNQVLKIYNSGHSGRASTWALSAMESIFTGSAAYSDSKMVGIGFGINDRGPSTGANAKEYRNKFKSNIKQMIEYFYSIGKQPFLLTTQSVVEAGTNDANQPMRTSMHIETIANEVKRELAREYNLELFEVNEFTERYLKLSSEPLTQIIPDKLHFGDIGHTYEAGMFFNFINPQTIYVDGLKVVDYTSQKVISKVSSDNVTLRATIGAYYKTQVNYTKVDTIDTQIFKAYVFVDKHKQLSIRADKNSEDSSTYVKVDGVVTTLTGLETSLGNLSIGLHTLEAWTGTSDKVDFNGFIIGA